jgi:CheY-like chemotaxis protein
LKQDTILKFLLIDDDEEDHEIFRDALADIDPMIVCITATSCEEALSYLKEHPGNLPNYIFLDLNMPGMKGKQCLEVLKRDEDLKHLPVIIYTTSDQPKDEDETTILGACYFMTKPMSLGELKKEIQSIIKMNTGH